MKIVSKSGKYHGKMIFVSFCFKMRFISIARLQHSIISFGAFRFGCISLLFFCVLSSLFRFLSVKLCEKRCSLFSSYHNISCTHIRLLNKKGAISFIRTFTHWKHNQIIIYYLTETREKFALKQSKIKRQSK